MRLLTLAQVLELHRLLIEQSGGSFGLRDQGALESALAQPAMTFGGIDLYPDLAHKVAALGHALIQNHPFLDGNKRIGHAVMEVTLVLNGYEITAGMEEQESLILRVAQGQISREELAEWLAQRVVPLPVGRVI